MSSPAALWLAGSATASQVRALLGLRWRMVRRPWARAGLLVLAAGLPLSAVLAVAVGVTMRAEADLAGTSLDGHASLVVAAVFASMAVLAVLAPLAAGGGQELYPAEQLVGYPVRPGTVVAASLLLSPLNLAWLTQALGVLGAAGYLAGSGPGLGAAVALAVAYVGCASALGQCVAWAVVGVRQARAGRLLVAAVAVAGGTTALGLAWAGHGPAALRALPTWDMAELVRQAGSGGRWVGTAAGLALGAFAAAHLAVHVCAWALSRGPDRSGVREGRPVRRRSPRRSVLAELTAVDRASVARSAPLRRGVLVLAALPGLAAAVPSVEWASVVMLPGLVSAGTGLLFGVNVFCLDGSGATWLASLPHDPRLAYLAKARVLAEVCLGTALITIAVAAVRAPADPTAAQLCAVGGAAVACPVAVVASCMRMSVRHPHRADMRSSRDTPAPPGAMVAYALRLSGVATLTAGVMSVFSYADAAWIPLLAAAVLTARPAYAIARAARAWRAPEHRARVVAAVSAG